MYQKATMHKCSSSQLNLHNAWPTFKCTNLEGSRTREDEDLSQLGSFSEAEVNDVQVTIANFPKVVGKCSNQSSRGGHPHFGHHVISNSGEATRVTVYSIINCVMK